MKRVWRFSSDAVAQAELFCFNFHGIPNPKPNITTNDALRLRGLTRRYCTAAASPPPPPSSLHKIGSLFTEKRRLRLREDLINKISILKNQLVLESSDSNRVIEILDENSGTLIGDHADGSVLLELLNQLDSCPSLALQVFNWKRKSSGVDPPMSVSEYSKGIKAAGRNKDVDLAIELFHEASEKGMRTTSTYNALMGAFMYNGLAERCQSLFCNMKKNVDCPPSIATYNILISLFSRLMMVDHMEATYQEINELGLQHNENTYNYLISGYISAWMWPDMERVFQTMKAGHVKPNLKTHLLMLRGYAHSGNLEKMEEMYSIVRDHVNENEIPLIRAMICAYCKSSDSDRVKKVEGLLKFLPQDHYRPWLNALLIRLYAQEDWLEKMENAINEAFEHRTPIATMGIMKCITATYFRCNAIEGLETFVKRAECAGWRLCRSLYHCKLALYGSQNRIDEMHYVLDEMESVNVYCTKKTLWIMYKAYLNHGQRSMVLKILGQMFKHGYEVPLEAFPS
ncbi:hypothetical protein PIB30_000965 [Stylosanthes scabra]|uniref:Pentatricopeptide repeat-containing protein n=1 Tax=Stylosanthes scabra TaxID=79078 RepID=A0ABU6S265_9FABA|nr:hypothetical protein [Stylosanthes scabra]